MKSVLGKILLDISASNELEFTTGDLGYYYLNTEIQEKICIYAGPKF